MRTAPRPKARLRTILFWTLIAIDTWIAFEIDARILSKDFTPAGFRMPVDFGSFWRAGAWVDAHRGLPLSGLTNVTLFIFPPPFLLIFVPLSRLKAVFAYGVWIALTSVFLVCACWLIKLRWRAICLGLISPPVLICLVAGQTGMFTSAALLLSLGLADSYPAVAGIMAGCLVVKPQCAILVPVCFLASRNWRALVAGAATVMAACLLALAIFGPGLWHYFFGHEIFEERWALTAPWPQSYQRLMVSAFMTLRSLGVGLGFSFFVQGMITICCALAVWYVWSRPAETFNSALRLLLTVILTLLATPYLHLYDMPCLAMALAGWGVVTGRLESFGLAAFWTIAGLYFLLSMNMFLTGGVLLLALALYFGLKFGRYPLPRFDP